MSRSLPDQIDLQGVLESDTGLRIEVSRGMRAPIINGQPRLKPCWRADCFTKPGKRWVFLVTFVDDTLPGLLGQFAALSKEGAVPVVQVKKP
jgi:hypothetical protein